MVGSRRSVLQAMLLIELQTSPARSVRELSDRVGKLRPSVSRSLQLLKADGLVIRERGAWRATEAGADEAEKATQAFRKAEADMGRLFEEMIAPTKIARKMTTFDSMGLQEMTGTFRELHLAIEASGVNSAIRSLEKIHRALPDLSGFAQMTRVANAFALPQLEAITRAVQPMLALQEHNAALLKRVSQSVHVGLVESALRGVNLSVTSAIDDSLALRAAGAGHWSVGFPALTLHFPKVSEALGVLTGEELSRLAVTNKLAEQGRWAGAVPPLATAGYARALRYMADDDFAGQERVTPGFGNEDLEVQLEALGSGYVEKYRGIWAALQSAHPDYMRHVAISARELVRDVLQYFVPDTEIDEEERNALLKPRIKKLLGGSDSGADWVYHFSLGAVGFYRRLNAYTHGRPGDEQALRALVIATDGLLLYFISQARRQS